VSSNLSLGGITTGLQIKKGSRGRYILQQKFIAKLKKNNFYMFSTLWLEIVDWISASKILNIYNL